MDLASFQMDMTLRESAAIIVFDGTAQRREKGPLTALIRPLPALFHCHVKLIGQEPGKIGCGKGFSSL